MIAKAKLLSWWEAARASYWFVPSLMAAAATALGVGMVELDAVVPDGWMGRVPIFYTGSADGARQLLSTIAGSMISLAGVVFSITIVALTLASSQFGPRLLRNFMRDVSNQVVLGMFVSAFLYCLVVLRKVHGGNDDGRAQFIPQLSMLLAVVMAAAGLGVLIYFIHHTAASIQAPNVIAAVTHDLLRAIDELYPERAGTSAPTDDETDGEATGRRAADQEPADFDAGSVGVCAGRGGYVQRVELGQLLAVAAAHDLVVRVDRRPGCVVQPDDAVVRVWPAARADAAVRRALRQTFTVSGQRSLAQDAMYAVDQLVEVAARALSPGVNDPFTAVQCIDGLAEALAHLAGRAFPSPYRLDDEGRLRVVAPPATFAEFAGAAFDEIRRDSRDSLRVMVRLLEAIERVAHRAGRPADRQCLAEHAAAVYEQAVATARATIDRRAVEERYAAVLTAVEPASPGDRAVVNGEVVRAVDCPPSAQVDRQPARPDRSR